MIGLFLCWRCSCCSILFVLFTWFQPEYTLLYCTVNCAKSLSSTLKSVCKPEKKNTSYHFYYIESAILLKWKFLTVSYLFFIKLVVFSLKMYISKWKFSYDKWCYEMYNLLKDKRFYDQMRGKKNSVNSLFLIDFIEYLCFGRF